MAEEQTKPVVRYVIFEDAVAGLWASVPQFGIGPGWDWCVGGGQTHEALEAAVEKLRGTIRMHCVEIINGDRATGEQLQLAKEIAGNRLDFELVEDLSAPTCWT